MISVEQFIGKRVLVTGSSRGIGFAIASAFLDAGATVGINGRGLLSVQTACDRLGSRAVPVPGNMSQSAEARAVVEGFLSSSGGLDVLICNVGDGQAQSHDSTDPQEWDRVLALNLLPLVNSIHTSREALVNSRGSVVAVSSIAGLRALGAPVAYSAAKAAVNAACSSWAREFGRLGIRVNVVAPGNIMFPGSVWERKMLHDKSAVNTMLSEQVPLGRFGLASEIAECCVYLSSDEASFITGSTFVIDGGQTA